MNIKDLVKDNWVHFQSFRQGHFYYMLEIKGQDDPYQFPVPLEDIGTATLNRTDKAITFMRYIRKAQEQGTLIKLAPNVVLNDNGKLEIFENGKKIGSQG